MKINKSRAKAKEMQKNLVKNKQKKNRVFA